MLLPMVALVVALGPMRDPPAMAPALIVFDLDGTLVDSLEDIAITLGRALAAHGRPAPARAALARMVGDGARTLVARAVGPDADAVDRILVTYLAAYAADPTPATRAMPSAIEVLDALAARGIAAAVCTNKPTEVARQVVARLFDGRIERVVGADAATPLKPAPDLVRIALGEVSPARAWMVGDGPQDVLAARAASVRSIAVRSGYGDPAAVAEAGPDVTIDRLIDLLPLL
jgi:phosphoglycolate phosphatase